MAAMSQHSEQRQAYQRGSGGVEGEKRGFLELKLQELPGSFSYLAYLSRHGKNRQYRVSILEEWQAKMRSHLAMVEELIRLEKERGKSDVAEQGAEGAKDDEQWSRLDDEFSRARVDTSG